ncbi:hypothetical protein ACFOYU_19305 [Microvirga sp. GCM10011540]|uniref:hypothetical protein n=1 Tax=Microvirga sp. GCM10011540 TaxID=3317338 RepID=UPI0036080EDE
MARSGGGRPTVENSITLDLRHLIRAGLGSGSPQSGNLQWTWPNSRQPVCYIEYQAAFGENTGTLEMASINRFNSLGEPFRVGGQRIHLVTTTPPYGGRRWWFVCPSTGRRVMKLYLPYGARIFASQKAYRLGYAVQREGALDQARRRTRKARKRIGGSSNLTEKLPFKPKWMRWATYWRHIDACQKAEGQMLKFLLADTEKILGRASNPNPRTG